MKQTRLIFFISLLLCSLSISANEKQRSRTRQSVTSRINRPIELRGSKEQRIAQNTKAANLGIGQIETDQGLLALAGSNNLVELRATDYYVIDRGAPSVRKSRRGKKKISCPPKENKIFVHAHVKKYIDSRARKFFKEFHKKLKVTSGARSLEEQIQMRTKGSCYYTPYAAQAGDPLEESLHVRALAIDVSLRVISVTNGRTRELAMSRKEVSWMRSCLIADKIKGVEFEIEKQENQEDTVIENQENPLLIETEPIEEKICYHIVIFSK